MKKEKKKIRQKLLSGAGFGLCLVLLPVLIANVLLIVRAKVRPDEVPGLFGVIPMAVATDSMSPAIRAGDLILVRKTGAETISVGDIIACFSPSSGTKSVVTHRVTAISRAEDGSLSFTTRGDANSEDDPVPVPASKLIGRFQRRIPKLGQLVLYMRTVPGLLLFVLLPGLLFAALEILSAKREGRRSLAENEELRKELAELRRKTPETPEGIRS